MCVGSEFQVDGAETENAREVKLLVMPVGLRLSTAATTRFHKSDPDVLAVNRASIVWF